MFTEDDLLPISALQHLLFCERQCALIHVEQLWAENPLTVEGRHLHERVDAAVAETRGTLRITRSLPLRSLRLGLTGRADVVEFHARDHGDGPDRAMPVEYKRGRAKLDDSDRVQLCAQALCLEEMLEVTVRTGALYYGATRRRLEVPLDEPLRQTTEAAARRLHELIDSRMTPPATREPKCDRCSLIELCLPSAMGAGNRASGYFRRALEQTLSDARMGEA